MNSFLLNSFILTDQKRNKKKTETDGMKGVVNDSITRKANDDSANSIGVTVNPDGHVQVYYNCKIHEFPLNELIFTEFIYFDRPEEEQEEDKDRWNEGCCQ